MSEFAADEQVSIEQALLWDDIVDTFRTHAYVAGMQASLDGETVFREPTRLVLESVPDDEYTIQLWGVIGKKQLLGYVVLLFLDKQGEEAYNYNITPGGSIKQYSAQPTPLDKEDLQDLRMELANACWDQSRSATCASDVVLFGIAKSDIV